MQRDPRTYGVQPPSMISPSTALGPSSADQDAPLQPTGPYIRVRLGAMDRNKKDLLIRFDLSVRTQFCRLDPASLQ